MLWFKLIWFLFRVCMATFKLLIRTTSLFIFSAVLWHYIFWSTYIFGTSHFLPIKNNNKKHYKLKYLSYTDLYHIRYIDLGFSDIRKSINFIGSLMNNINLKHVIIRYPKNSWFIIKIQIVKKKKNKYK